MTIKQPIPATLIIGWLIISLSIVLVATLAFPGDGSGGFWLRVAFTELLSLALWGSGAIYVLVFAGGLDSVRRLGGIAPAFIILMSTYVVLSLLCLLAHGLVAQGGLADRGIWIFQVIRTAIAMIGVIFLATARAGAASNLAFDHDLAMSPRQLHDLIASRELAGAVRRSPKLGVRLKRLREVLLYSLNTSTALSQTQEYQALSRAIVQFCSDLSALKETGDDQTDASIPLNDVADDLAAKVKAVADQCVTR